MVKRQTRTNGFAAFVQDQLSDLDGLVMKRMFGGTGLYLEDAFFGIIYSDRLYFRVSADTIDEYKQRKMKPFKPFEGKSGSRRYYEVPLDILESPADLVRWARKATRS